MKVVVDASVAIKWFFAENFNSEADCLLSGDYYLCAPDFILLEASSVLWKKRRHGEIGNLDDSITLAILREAFKELIPASTLTERILEIAKELEHSVYDCVYLSTAEILKGKVVTADWRFYDRVMNSPHSHHIAWVEHPLI